MVLWSGSRTLLLSLGLGLGILLYVRCRKLKEEKKRTKKKKQGSVNIGGIFGMDVGGTLTKIVYFEAKLNGETNKNQMLTPEPLKRALTHHGDVKIDDETGTTNPLRRSNSLGNLNNPDHQAALQKIYNYMDSTRQNPQVTVRDDVLSFYSSVLGGKLHFLLFETRNMISAIKLISSTSITENISTIGCTGGGAHKYAKDFEDQLGITVTQLDELGCLIRGMHFALTNIEGECYSYRNDKADGASTAKDKAEGESAKSWQKDVKEHTKKVTIPFDSLQNASQFPYLLVNIGSGVSILKVNGPGMFERVSGSSLGGGTYWGLCRLLTRCATFEEVLDIAESGDATEVDMLVRDIYGGSYDSMNLSSTMVASSFGKLVMKEHPRDGVKEEDLAIALLMMITNNIGQVSYLNAQVHKCSKIYFVGTFLRHNPISCRRLAFAIDFWSKGSMEALFLTHEGYFGALGTFLLSAFGNDCDKILSFVPSKSLNNNATNGDHEEGKALRFVSQNMSVNDFMNENNGKSVFGIPLEFLNKIRNWNPIPSENSTTSNGNNSNSNADKSPRSSGQYQNKIYRKSFGAPNELRDEKNIVIIGDHTAIEDDAYDGNVTPIATLKKSPYSSEKMYEYHSDDDNSSEVKGDQTVYSYGRNRRAVSMEN